MFNQRDQADGLRRIMGTPNARMISVLAADGQSAHAWLTNLAASMVGPAQRMLLIQATAQENHSPSLQTVLLHKSTLNHSISPHPLGFDVACLSENSPITPPLSGNLNAKLDGIVKQLAYDYDTVMIEAQLDQALGLPLPMMSQHELVIQMGRDEEAIKAAYITIKQVCQQYGNRPFGVVVTRSNQAQGQQYFMRLSQVCKQFLGVSLNFLGAIPDDDALRKSSAMGRSVIDAFPKAQAAIAFKAVASSLAKHRLTPSSLAVA